MLPFKIKETLIRFINEQIGRIEKSNANSVANRQLHKTAGFEGSPLYLFLLDELVALDKLDILALPDDFKYHNEPFFVYYQRRLVENLNRFRVNKFPFRIDVTDELGKRGGSTGCS